MNEDSVKKKPMGDRCAADGQFGRCQLRGTIGFAGADGGTWYCSWHAKVILDSGPSSREEFETFISDYKTDGYTIWNHRTSGEWWDLIQGIDGPGGYDRRKKIEQVRSIREIPSY